MAAKTLQKLDDQITCSVCLDRYREPKVLQCHHVYCKACLEKLLPRGGARRTAIVCPTCRKETSVQEEGGVSALDPAFYINELMEMRDSLHGSFSGPGSVGSSLSSTGLDSVALSLDSRWDNSLGTVEADDKPLPPPKPMCPLHDKNELQLYCETCCEVICFQCTIRTHNGHKYELVTDVAGKHKAEIVPLLGIVKGLVTRIEKAMVTVEIRSEEVSDLRASIEGDVHGVFKDLHEALSTREAELVDQLDKVGHRKLKALAGERDRKETVLAQIGSCTQNVQETMDTKTDVEILCLKKTLMQKLQQATALFKDDPDLLKVRMEADMVFSSPPELAPQCKGFGLILTPESIDPQKCVAKGHGLEMACVGKRAVVFMKVYDFKGDPFLKPIPHGSMQCKVVFVRTGDAEKCNVVRETGNVYEISYTPTERGAHTVHIKIDDVHMRGSPFSVIVRSPVEKLGNAVTVFDDMIQPWAVAINQREQLIVSECSEHRVTIFGYDGRKIRSFGSHGTGKTEFKFPRGIALDSEGNIFVVDPGNCRVQKFTESGEFLAWGGTAGEGRDQFRDPRGLAFNTINNKLYVCDVHSVQIMNSDLTFAGSFGKQGSGEGQFTDGFSAACDGKGNVYVSDRDNKNIQVFTAEGQFLKMFLGRGGSLPKVFGRTLWGTKAELSPVGLAVDTCGLVYVSDNTGHRISVFSPDGTCVTAFGKEGFASGEFKSPRGIATTEGGVVYVCDFCNDRLQVF